MQQSWMMKAAMVCAGLMMLGACSAETTSRGEQRPIGSGTTSAGVPASPDLDRKAATSGRAVAIDIIDTNFRPTEVSIATGTTVDWTQIGDQPHSVTAADGSFDSSPRCSPIESDVCLGEGDSFSHTFESPGEFTYYCRVHGLPDGTGMVGTITVK